MRKTGLAPFTSISQFNYLANYRYAQDDTHTHKHFNAQRDDFYCLQDGEKNGGFIFNCFHVTH